MLAIGKALRPDSSRVREGGADHLRTRRGWTLVAEVRTAGRWSQIPHSQASGGGLLAQGQSIAMVAGTAQTPSLR